MRGGASWATRSGRPPDADASPAENQGERLTSDGTAADRHPSRRVSGVVDGSTGMQSNPTSRLPAAARRWTAKLAVALFAVIGVLCLAAPTSAAGFVQQVSDDSPRANAEPSAEVLSEQATSEHAGNSPSRRARRLTAPGGELARNVVAGTMLLAGGSVVGMVELRRRRRSPDLGEGLG